MTSNIHDICILGAGISGLSTATFLLEKNPALNILILEKQAVPGGAISTFHEDGYMAEWGPHGFLDNCEESKKLIHHAGLAGELDTAPLKQFVRYICLDGQLRCIPQSPLKIISQPLIPLTAKLRFLRGLWKKPLSGNPTVAKWTEHAFGRALIPFADAVFTGTYAGDINRLQMNAAMPGIRLAELNNGSLIKGLLQRRKKTPNTNSKGLPTMTSFKTGMGRLPEAMAASLDSRCTIHFNAEVTHLERDGSQWQLGTPDQKYSCKELVTAIPVNATLALLKRSNYCGLTPPPLKSIPQAEIATVLFGFDMNAEIPFGFGYLAPRKEQRFSLGTLFSSHMFPGRAPENCQLVEALVGGRLHPERVSLPDEELINGVYKDLRELMELPTAPIYKKVLRPLHGIPQFEQGYMGLVQWRNQIMEAESALHICGFGWNGIGINDMTKAAEKIADRITSQNMASEDAAIKKIYF